jgi:hypothetical protein
MPAVLAVVGIDMVNFGVVMTLLIMQRTSLVNMCLYAVESFAKVDLGLRNTLLLAILPSPCCAPLFPRCPSGYRNYVMSHG